MNSIKSNKKNKKKIFKQISLQKDKINILKKFNDKYNILENVPKKEKKRKFFFNRNRNEKANNDVESILKDLQTKIKNSIILRSEDLQFGDKIVSKRKPKIAKEKNNINTLSKFSKKELVTLRKSKEYSSKSNLIDNNNNNESQKDNQKITEEQNLINNINNELIQPLKKMIYVKKQLQIFYNKKMIPK